MRKAVTSNGESGIIAARSTTKPLVFVLFDGDDEAESKAAWFLASDVTIQEG